MVSHYSGLFSAAALVVSSRLMAITCTGIPDSDAPLVTYCETETSYFFDLGGDQVVFSKTEFESRLRASVQNWWSAHSFDAKSLASSHVEVWITAPEANPSAAQARAVVFSTMGNASLSFDLNDKDWVLRDEESAILDRSSYPETYGWRPSQVMIAFAPGADATKTSQLLSRAGLKLGQETSPGWYKAESKMFDETGAINRLMQLDRWTKLVKSAQTNQLFEWIAVRGKTVQFQMSAAAHN